MSWTNAYIGLPYQDMGRSRSGCDCWGLARLVYERELQIALPSYVGDYASADERKEVAALISQETVGSTWSLTDDPQPFDLLVFRQGRYGSHIGILVDNTAMLHMAEEEQAKIAIFSTERWSRRLIGVYRHVERLVNGGHGA